YQSSLCDSYFMNSCFLFFFSRSLHHRDLHSFPTRRSSDLAAADPGRCAFCRPRHRGAALCRGPAHGFPAAVGPPRRLASASWDRSEEHTSELQSLRHLVCRLLLEKKKLEISIITCK